MHSFIAAALVAVAQGALAAEAPDSPPPASQDAERKKLEEEIAKELGAAPRAGAAAPAPAAGQPASGAAPAPDAQPATGGNPYARILMLPDISAIGDFAGTYHN